MCDLFRWDRDDNERMEARELLKDAMTRQFNGIYGTDVNDIDSWRNLCRALDIAPIPDALEACRDVSNLSHTARNLN
jgi:hypothetical protein